MIAARPTLRDFLSVYYQRHRPQAREGTLAQYQNVLALLKHFARRDLFCDELSTEQVLAFREWRLSTERVVKGRVYPPPTPATVNKDVRHVLAIWNLARECRFTSREPDTKIVPLPEELDNPACWSTGDLTRILKACEAEAELFMPIPAADFWKALVLLIYYSGGRITALMEARIGDVDLDAPSITLRAASQKQRICQVLGLQPPAVEALRRVHGSDPVWLFPWPYDQTQPGWRALGKRYKRILKRAGLPSGRRDMFHKIRRTTATYIVNELGLQAAQEQLGHSSPKVTMRYLDHTKLARTQHAARVLPAL